jgi:hypothetical protein
VSIPQVEQECSNCRFHIVPNCRRYAPRPMTAPNDYENPFQEGDVCAWFPVTLSCKWCGEWEPKAAP